MCEDIYARLTAQGIDVLYDDRGERAGGKFSDMDLIGYPGAVIEPRGVEAGGRGGAALPEKNSSARKRRWTTGFSAERSNGGYL